jgi:hypothetical protein
MRETERPAAIRVGHGEKGRCVLAARPLNAGQVVLEFGGPLLRAEEIRDFTHCLEIGPNLFLGPSGGSDDYVNHSCDPNCAVELADAVASLRALRDIAEGEEITYDYSTLMVRDPTSFECRCGASACRGVVGPFRTLPQSLRRQYERGGIVPPFVLAGR